jgi:hypothetical protein
MQLEKSDREKELLQIKQQLTGGYEDKIDAAILSEILFNLGYRTRR